MTARRLGEPMRRLTCALLAGLTLVGGVAYAVQAHRADGERARLRLSVAPAGQGVTAGERMRFSVTVRRSGGFDGPVRLRVRGLPPGTRGALVPAGQDGAALTVRTSASAPAGRTRVTIVAAGGGRTTQTRLVVRVVAPGSRSFTLVATPRRRVVVPGETATYRIRVARGTRLRRRVRISVAALPPDTHAGWSRTSASGSPPALLWHWRTLQIRVAPDARPASARLVVVSRARLAGRWIGRVTVVVLDIRRPIPFRIDGDLGRRLYPGASAPVDLTLTNPHRFAIRVTRLTMATEATTTGARCGTGSFAVRQYAGPYPLTLQPGDAQLSALVSDSRLWPRLSMRNLPINQDACKDAHLTLAYGGTAIR